MNAAERHRPLPMRTRGPALTTADLATLPGLLRAAARPGVTDLAMGFDATPPSAAMCEAAIDAMRAGHHHYVDARGLPELRAVWAAHVGESSGRGVDSEGEVTITAGASGGIFSALMGLGCADRSVVVFDPGYALHVRAVEAAGGRVVRVPRDPRTWQIALGPLAQALADGPRALIVTNPCNPTGAVTSPDLLDAVARLCARRGVALIVDEAYTDLTFAGPAPCAWHLRDTGVELVVVRSLSKSHHASGWRIGAVFASAELSARLQAVHTVSTLGVPTPLQFGALSAFGAGRDHLPMMRRRLRTAHDRLVGALTTLGVRVVPAEGGMFVCADIGPTGAADDMAFVRWLFSSAGLLVAPGRLFFADPRLGRRHVRLCFARSPDFVGGAVEQMRRLAARTPRGAGPAGSMRR